MEPGRRPAPDRRHTARHSTGGLLGSRSARVVAAGLTVSIGVVGGVVVAERVGSSDGSSSQAQVVPPVVSSAPPATASALPAPAPAVAESVPPGGTAGTADPLQVDEQVQEQGTPASTDTGTEPVRPEPVSSEPVTPERVTPEAVAPEPVTPEPVTPEPVTPEPVVTEPDVPEVVAPTTDVPAERVLLQTTLEVPVQWQIPSGAVSFDVPLPDPVTVTGTISSPEPGRLDAALTVRPGGRHLAEDPAPEGSAADVVARHRAAVAPPG